MADTGPEYALQRLGYELAQAKGQLEAIETSREGVTADLRTLDEREHTLTKRIESLRAGIIVIEQSFRKAAPSRQVPTPKGVGK